MNKLYFGDNLDWLPTIPSDSVDLVYLDPPFNSQANYNILYRSPLGFEDNAQHFAFQDTWRWGLSADQALSYVRVTNPEAFGLLTAFNNLMQKSDLMAYLAMMTARLIELRRVLKPTGSLYLHCDPTASHYLKIIADSIFSSSNFQNEVIWKRTSAHPSAKRWGPVHDNILFYSKTANFTWNRTYSAYDADYINTFFDMKDGDGRRWKRCDMTGAGVRNGETGRPWRGIDITSKGRHWGNPPSVLDDLDARGRIHWPTKSDGMPRLKQYPEDLPGVPIADVISDIRALHNLAAERLHYPTQKPLALLERIISASSNPGDVVLDPFCGCGTAIDAAQKLGRRWIGIDITVLAIDVVEKRLRHMGVHKGVDYEVEGIPRDLVGAHRLFDEDPYDFQNWALTLVDGQPRAGGKRGADKGVDGLIYYRHDAKSDRAAIVSVKGGKNLHADQVRDLIGAMHNQGADFGVMITLRQPTSAMKKAADEAGSTDSGGKLRQKVQIRTIDKLLAGYKFDLPPVYDIVSAAAAARRAASPRTARQPSAEELRNQPSLKLPITGGKAKAQQTELPIDDGALIAQPERRAVRRRRA